jgi:3-oxoacyl-[acyl-carrier-protein] synthase-3
MNDSESIVDMRILGTGSATPQQVLTNEMLSEMVDTSDEWIVSRTGIKSRHIALEETTRSLARDAAAQAISASGIKPTQIGVVICATLSSELRCPSVACFLQSDLGLREDILTFDLNAACSGFIYALITAAKLVTEDAYALVVGAEVLSRLTDYTDRSTCILFGDGAGAVVVAPARKSDNSFYTWATRTRTDDTILTISDLIRMDGSAVFRFAVDALTQIIQKAVTLASLQLDQIDLIICHQANERIIESAARRLGLPITRFFINLVHFGNTSAASVPLAMDEAVRGGFIKPDDTVVLAGFGGGLTAGAICMKWK